MGESGGMTTPKHQELIEAAAWECYRAAALVHDAEHTHRTWLDRQRAYHDRAGVFLADEGEAA